MKIFLEKYKKYLENNPAVRNTVGIFLIALGFLALVTPLTPGSWLVLVGLELLGIRLIFVDWIAQWIKKKKYKKPILAE